MSVMERLNEAADAIANDKHCDQMTRAVGAWLRAEYVTQMEMEPLTNLISVAIEHAGGPKSYLRVGKREDGEIAMQSDCNETALAVADEVLRRYGLWQIAG